MHGNPFPVLDKAEIAA